MNEIKQLSFIPKRKSYLYNRLNIFYSIAEVLKKEITSQIIRSQRPPKEHVEPDRPYFYLHEEEVQKSGRIKKVNTIFLTNRECPFTCVMCDLWRHTLNKPTPKGSVPRQIEFALERLPAAVVIKLYNSGNFFDGKAIPKSDYEEIARLLSGYEHVIVENHPKLIGPFIPRFAEMLSGNLEIAMGLETVHPDVLPRLNKQMTAADFAAAAEFLTRCEIDVRAFVLLNPPFLTDEEENKRWCLKSVQFAFSAGASACSVIPVRGGNGIMEQLRKQGEFLLPTLRALEDVFDDALSMGRVFCDTWDLERFSQCDICIGKRKERLRRMNITQHVLPRISCECSEQVMV